MRVPFRPLRILAVALLTACGVDTTEPARTGVGQEMTGPLGNVESTLDLACSSITHLWPGEGNTADVVGVNNGTPVGGVGFAAGLIGQAFSFDGVDDYITLGDVLAEQGGTVEFWLNRGPVGAGSEALVSDLYFGGFAGSTSPFGTGQSTPTFYVRSAGNLLWDVGNSRSNNAGPLSAGVWHHLAMTWASIDASSSKQVSVYVDGALVGGPATATVSNFPQPWVGAFSFNGGLPQQHATALIDELTIYSRALAPPEVAAIHAAGAAGKCSASNQAPVANVGGPYQSTEDVPLEFDASGSSDPDGDPLSYGWDFGDGSLGIGVNPTHTYADAGSYTVTLTVEDGNSGSHQATAQVAVHYPFGGFFAPVDHPEVAVNRAKAGSAIPVKFTLGGDRGLEIFLDGYPKPQPYDCQSGDPIDPIEQTVQATANTLSYDAETGRYTYVWKTDKAWASGCRRLVLGLKDASEWYANFQIVK